ncbi:hypothetical protein M8J76_003369 [Diaphorina citri]|nr:hypothetical protein M8J76_003369 [Diaphorina citri]
MESVNQSAADLSSPPLDLHETVRQCHPTRTVSPYLCPNTVNVNLATLGEPGGSLDYLNHSVTVRYLTKRYIGEYSSSTDMIYRHNTTIDNTTTEVEILDTCKCSIPVAPPKDYLKVPGRPWVRV